MYMVEAITNKLRVKVKRLALNLHGGVSLLRLNFYCSLFTLNATYDLCISLPSSTYDYKYVRSQNLRKDIRFLCDK